MNENSLVVEPPRATPLGRFVWGLLGAGCATVVGLSAWLRPDPHGFGTHRQLGLPPCEFGAITGIPCPGCGLTTSFAHMAHGQVLSGFGAHLMGPSLFLITLGIAVYSPWAIVKKRPLAVLIEGRVTSVVLAVTAALGLLTWTLRLGHVLPFR